MVDKKYTLTMASKNKEDNPILKGLAILGGGYLFVELMKLVGKKTTFYTCTKCQFDQLEYGTKKCPNCNSNLVWPTNP